MSADAGNVVVHEYGESALLVEHPEPLRLWQALRLWAALRDLEGVVDAVPAARTVLVTGPGARAAVDAALLDTALSAALPAYSPPAVEAVEIAVVYDGADLDDFGGLTRTEVVALHTDAEYVVAFMGFAPGFGYLTGLPAPLQQPRLATPRTAVPAGSVAVAGEWCGVYPTDSPGGWRLLGRTDAVLFDVERDPPALLAPGTRVRFVAR